MHVPPAGWYFTGSPTACKYACELRFVKCKQELAILLCTGAKQPQLHTCGQENHGWHDCMGQQRALECFLAFACHEFRQWHNNHNCMAFRKLICFLTCQKPQLANKTTILLLDKQQTVHITHLNFIVSAYVDCWNIEMKHMLPATGLLSVFEICATLRPQNVQWLNSVSMQAYDDCLFEQLLAHLLRSCLKNKEATIGRHHLGQCPASC
jgi:hypothetical protein